MAICMIGTSDSYCGEMDSICTHSPCHDVASRLWDELKMNGIEFQEFYDDFWIRHGDKFESKDKIVDDYWNDFKKFKLLVRDCGLSFAYHKIPMRMYLITDLIRDMVEDVKASRDKELEVLNELHKWEAAKQKEAKILKEKFLNDFEASRMGTTKPDISLAEVGGAFNPDTKTGMEPLSTLPSKRRTNPSDKSDSKTRVEIKTTTFSVGARTNRFAKIGT